MRIVFGMVDDKDIYGVMSLLPKNANYYFTKGSTKRAFPETSLKVFGDQFGLKGECYPTVEKAYQAAITGTTAEDFIFIGGSTYVVADFLKTRS
jgi:dihydrofolate synthase/folylpolyglutamate synthase